MVANKKVKNATTTVYNNISFKSKLEVSCYKKLETSGFTFTYESDKIVLWSGESISNVAVYEPDKTKQLSKKIQGFKLRDMTYTPDFKLYHKGYTIYFDVKGHVNDVYPIKKKMLIQHLNNIVGEKYIFFEPHNVRQMLQTIEIIKKL